MTRKKETKKAMCENLDNQTKRTFESRGQKRSKRDNLGDNEKEQLRNYDKKRNKRLIIIDTSMLTTPALGLIEEDFKGAIQEGPNYIYGICWKFKFPNA